MSQRTLLMILDGWGIATNKEVSAVDVAKTPFMDSLYKEYNYAKLRTDGRFVGLPDGQMGNSEVGHMNLGAGRIVYQDLTKISLAIENLSIYENKVLKDCINYAKAKDKTIHLMGLLSDGGVHSHIRHLEGLLSVISHNQHSKVLIHAFTDGRDVDPKSGVDFLKRINSILKKVPGQLASVIGRYYAMDRDKRWKRIKKAYDLLVNGIGKKSDNLVESVQESYDNGITDEFIEPIVKVDANGNPIGLLRNGDVIIFFNFRTDRGRELTQVLSQRAFPELNMNPLDLYYVTLTNYDDSYSGIKILFDKDNISQTLGEILSKNGKTQLRIAETEKYPHVTFFFNGGREDPFENEFRIICPSPKVATYDLKPEMSAFEVTEKVIREIEDNQPDFVCINYANPDMVGHTGDFNAAVKACQTVDTCTEKVINAALDHDYTCLVIADHGNCEVMKNEDGSPNTAHTTNPVPLILVDKQKRNISDGILADIAPTILDIMGIEIPIEMNQKSLISNS